MKVTLPWAKYQNAPIHPWQHAFLRESDMMKFATNEERTAAEKEAGKRIVELYGKMEHIEKSTRELEAAFPRLLIGSVLNKPYTHVMLRVTFRPNLASLMEKAVLDGDLPTDQELEFEEPIEEYPSDHLIAKLALIS